MKAELIKGDFKIEDKEKHIVLMGGDPDNPTWKEYVDGFIEPFQPHIVAIKECIEKEGLIGECADRICNNHYFSFEDGSKVAFSWRVWGDLMQSIVNEREGYMTYYM